MPQTLKMPKLSPTMVEGTLAKWHKKVGDRIEAGDLLLEIATDKATVEYNALDEGWLRKVLVEEGAVAHVNQAIGVFTENEQEDISNYVPEGGPRAAPVPKVMSIRVTDVTKTPEAHANQPHEGQVHYQPTFAPEPPVEGYEFGYPTGDVEERIVASPLARKLAKEKGIDITTVKGSGPRGRIVSEDLQRAQPKGKVTFGHREMPTVVPGTYAEESLNPVQKTIAERLRDSKSFIPHFYVEMEIDANPLASLYEQLKAQELKVTINDCIVRACALALRKHPEVNSGFHSVNNTFIRFKTIDISVAVKTKEGLITPIIRHADYKNLGEISVEVRHLASRAREGKLQPQEYKGGSFTVSNLGMYGVTNFQAIINPPQAAILAVGGILERPVVRNGQVLVGKVMNITLSADHRVLDGVIVAEFLKTVKYHLESPLTLIL